MTKVDKKPIILNIIFEAVDDSNALAKPDRQLAKSEDTPLFGEGSTLDSLGIVSLMINIEGLIQERFDTEVVIVDDKAMSEKKSPFRTISTLVDFIEKLIERN